jgi:hypothetical protein
MGYLDPDTKIPHRYRPPRRRPTDEENMQAWQLEGTEEMMEDFSKDLTPQEREDNQREYESR